MAEQEKKIQPLEIKVDDGYRRIPITNTYGEEIGVFRFNPTDVGIIERYNRLADTFDAITEPLEGVVGANEGEDDETDIRRVEALNEATKRLYAAVDELFGGNAAEAFFGSVNPFSPVNGAFYCENVLQSVGTFISAQFDAETKMMNARVAKYTRGNKKRVSK